MFRVGVVTDPLPGHERFRGWIAIPYLGRERQPLSMRFRCPVFDKAHNCRDLGHGKYMSMTDEPSRLFGVMCVHEAVAARSDIFHVTEGEFDAMVLRRLGHFAGAAPGAQGWKRHYRRMLAGFSRVLVWGDADEAGADFNRRLTTSMRQAKAVRLRNGQDVTDAFVAGGAEAITSLIAKELHQ